MPNSDFDDIPQQNKDRIYKFFDIMLQSVEYSLKLQLLSQILQTENYTPHDSANIIARLPEDDYPPQYVKFFLQVKALLIKKYPALYLLVPFSIKHLQKLQQLGIPLTTNANGYNLLHQTVSANFGDTEEIKQRINWLIEQGIDFNSIDQAYGSGTPLHIYLANEQFDLALHLIKLCKNKLNLSARDKEHKTPLIIAAKVRAEQVVIELLPYLNKDTINLKDKDGRTALHYAIILGCPKAVQALINKGAKADIRDRFSKTALDCINFNSMQTEAVLKSIEIDQRRAENSSSNGVYYIVDKEDNEILATKSNAEKFFNKYKNDEDEQVVEYLDNLRKTLSGKSLITAIQEKRIEIKHLLQNLLNITGNQQQSDTRTSFGC